MGMIALYTAYSALQAAQAGIDTTSHNVANAATEGYTRQRVDQATRLPYRSPVGTIGTGVDVVDISRARDRFADRRVWHNTEAAGRFSTQSGLLEAMDQTTLEPDAGVGAALGDLWSSFEQLSLDPPDPAARRAAIAGLETVASRVRDLAHSWSAQVDRATAETRDTVDEVNGLLARLGPLNAQILGARGAGSPNDLLDARDAILDRLSSLAGVTITDAKDGTVRVSLDGLSLVDGAAVHRLSVDASGAIALDTGTPVEPGGELAGYRRFLGVDAPDVLSGLDTFAANLADALNAAHAAGFTPSGAPGGPLLIYTPGSAASTLTVAVSDPAEIAAAADPGPPVAAYDGRNAEAIAGLRSAPVALGGTATIDAAYRTVITDLGSRARLAKANDASARQLLDNAHAIRESRHGVSLDEEMTNMLRYQRSYEAAARVMTAVDQVLQTLVERTGIVGR